MSDTTPERETHAGPCPWCDAMVVDGQCSRDGCEFETTAN